MNHWTGVALVAIVLITLGCVVEAPPPPPPVVVASVPPAPPPQAEVVIAQPSRAHV